MGLRKARRNARRTRQIAYVLAAWLAVLAFAGAGILVWRPLTVSSPAEQAPAESAQAAGRYLGVVVAKAPDDTCTKFVLDNASGQMTAKDSGRCEDLSAGMQRVMPADGPDVRRLRSIRKVFRHEE